MEAKLSTEILHTENNIQTQTIHNENTTVETQTIVQNNININNISTKEPELEDYNFPKPIDSFKGREGELQQLDKWLFSDHSKMVIIWGLPGFGKSELLKQFAQESKLNNKIKYICWIEASNNDTLEHSLKNLAEILNLPKVDGRSLMQKVSSQYQDSETLFLFDDVYSPRSLLDWETPRGCWTLVSSQCGAWGTKPRKELGPLELEAAVSVLQHLQEPVVTAHPKLDTLAVLLDNAPLALQLAAAYIRQEMTLFPNFNLLKYIKKLEKSREKFVNEPLPEDTFLPYRYSIQAAMKLSIEKIRNRNKFESNLALDILNISAYLYLNSITEDLLLQFSFIKNKLKEAKDEDEERDPEKKVVRGALEVLQSHSFVHLEHGYVRIHGLVQQSLLFYHNKLNQNIETLYTSCLEYVLNNKLNWHSETILRQADKNLKIFKKFFEKYKSIIIENKSGFNDETLRLFIIMILNNTENSHGTKLLYTIMNHYFQSFLVDFGIEVSDIVVLNFIKNISNYSFLQILVLAGAEKCLAVTIEELGSQTKDIIREHQLLISAIYSQQPNTINLLLRYGEDINKIIVPGLPTIHFAVCVLNIDTLNILLKHNNVDINAKSEKGDTCICFAILNYFLIKVDIMENVFLLTAKLRTLVDHGAYVYNVTERGFSILHVAVQQIQTAMHIKLVEFIMDELQVNVNTPDSDGKTALHIIFGRRDIHKIDNELMCKLVDILVKRGANIHIKDNNGYSPLDIIEVNEFHFLLPILECNNIAGSFHVLHYAVRILNLDILNVILAYNNTNVNARDDDGLMCICKAFLYSCKFQLDTGDKICHVIDALVDRGAFVNNVTNDGWSLLHVAVRTINTAKDLKVVEFIVDKLKVDVNTRSNNGMTALNFILYRRKVHEIDDELTEKLVNVLMKRGANIHIKDNNGYSPLDVIEVNEFHFLLPILECNNIAGSFHVLHYAVRILNLDILNVILAYNNTDVNVRDDNGLTCICKAFLYSCKFQLDTGDKICHVIDALVDRGAFVNNVTNDGWSLLHVAVRTINTAKDLKVVEFIVDKLKVDVNTRSNNGMTALNFILYRRKVHEIDDELTEKLVNVLMKRGANIHIKDNNGYSPLDVIEVNEFHFLLPILECNNIAGSFHVLHYAVRILNLDILNVILAYNNTDVNVRDDNGLTCICKAFLYSCKFQLDTGDKICHVIDALVDRGAFVNNVTNDGWSLLHVAVRTINTAKDLKVVEFIVDKLKVDVNTRSNNGMTALNFILYRRKVHEIDDELTEKLVNVLMKRGANIHIKDNNGYSPLDVIEVNEFHFLLPILECNNIAGSFHVLHYAVRILNLDILNVILAYNNTDVNVRDDNGLTCICTAFLYSCKFQLDTGDKICHVIDALVDRGAFVNNVTNDGWSLLHVAVRTINTAKDLKVVEFIVDKLKVDVNTRSNNGLTALYFILYRREVHEIDDELTGKLVDTLMKRGASIHVKNNKYGYSPLDIIKGKKFHFLLPILESNNVAGTFQVLHYAVSILNLDILNVILDYKNTDVNARDGNGYTCICNAVISLAMQLDTEDNICHVIRSLVRHGASVYEITTEDWSLLHVAVRTIDTLKDLKVVEFIVDKLQVDMNRPDIDGMTALHLILSRRIWHEIDDELTGKLVNIMMKYGASIHVKNNNGYSSLDVIKIYKLYFLLPILESNNIAGSFHVLHYAVSILNLDILNVILDYNNTNVNAPDNDGLTCICKAFLCSYKMQLDTRLGDKICHVIRVLVSRGASVYNVTNKGWSLLHMTALSINTANGLKVMEFIVDQLQMDVNTQDTNGRTTLHFILNKRIWQLIDDEVTSKMVDVLVKRGACVHVKNNNGCSPLDVIKKYKFYFLLPILESNGVHIDLQGDS